MRIWMRKSALIQPRTSVGKSDGVLAHPFSLGQVLRGCRPSPRCTRAFPAASSGMSRRPVVGQRSSQSQITFGARTLKLTAEQRASLVERAVQAGGNLDRQVRPVHRIHQAEIAELRL